MKMKFEINHYGKSEVFTLDIDPASTSIHQGFITVFSADHNSHWTWALESVKTMEAE